MNRMRELADLPENEYCADCDAKGPDWTSINLGIFLCIKCAGIHRNLGVHISKVRSIDLDTSCWDDAQVEVMSQMGNVRSREIFERHAPHFYMRPAYLNGHDNSLIRENWIRAKYERKEFMATGESDDENDGCSSHNNNKSSSSGSSSSSSSSSSGGGGGSSSNSSNRNVATDNKDAKMAELADKPHLFLLPEGKGGWLEKGNRSGKWQTRWCIVHEHKFQYFKQQSDSYCAGEIDLTDIAIEIPTTPYPGKRFTFHIVTPSRTYPFSSQNADDMFNWIHIIKRINIYYSKICKGENKHEEPDLKITYGDMIQPKRQGELTKQGGRWKSWNKRYCVLTNRYLYYFKNAPDNNSSPDGAIDLYQCDMHRVSPAEASKPNCISFTTHNRVYFASADSPADMKAWMDAIQVCLDNNSNKELVDFSDEDLKEIDI